MALAVGAVVALSVTFASLVPALVLAVSFVMAVAVLAPLRGVDAREGGTRHRGDHDRDREEKEGLAESSGDHGRP